MPEVARVAVHEYIDRHSRDGLIDRVTGSELPRFAELRAPVVR